MSRKVAPKADCPVVPSRVPEKKKPPKKQPKVEQPSEIKQDTNSVIIEKKEIQNKNQVSSIDISNVSYETIKALKIDITEEEFNRLKSEVSGED